MPGHPQQGKLEEVLTLGEAMELMFRLVSQMPGIEDKKKCESESRSDSESCAVIAGAQTSATNGSKNTIAAVTSAPLAMDQDAEIADTQDDSICSIAHWHGSRPLNGK